MRYLFLLRSAERAAPSNNCSSDGAQFISERIILGVQCNGVILKNGRISPGTSAWKAAAADAEMASLCERDNETSAWRL